MQLLVPKRHKPALKLQENDAEKDCDRRADKDHLVQWIVARQIFDQHVVDRNADPSNKHKGNANSRIVYARICGH